MTRHFQGFKLKGKTARELFASPAGGTHSFGCFSGYHNCAAGLGSSCKYFSSDHDLPEIYFAE